MSKNTHENQVVKKAQWTQSKRMVSDVEWGWVLGVTLQSQQRWEDPEFEVSLDYIVSSRSAWHPLSSEPLSWKRPNHNCQWSRGCSWVVEYVYVAQTKCSFPSTETKTTFVFSNLWNWEQLTLNRMAFTFLIYFFCVAGVVGLCVEVREQLVGTDSLCPPCGSQGLIPGLVAGILTHWAVSLAQGRL